MQGSNLRVELGNNLEVLFEIRGKDSFDDEEAEPLELCRIEVLGPVEVRVGHEQSPGGCGMVVLQDRPVVIKDRLGGGRRQSTNIDICLGELRGVKW